MKKSVSNFFFRDEAGAITPLMLALFIGILLSTGMALDLFRHETERAALQNALDRGVLSAASLTQTVSPESILDKFVTTRPVANSAAGVTSNNTITTGSRRVAAQASSTVDTYFLRLAGLESLPVVAKSTAVAGRQAGSRGIEISMVLDISGTMRFNNRLVNLRPAANAFIDNMLADGADAYTTISIVPYAGQVNPGPTVFNLLGGVRDFNGSSCFEFSDSDFTYTGLPAAGSYAQVPNFHHWAIDWNWMDWGWCPADATAIKYFSNDAAALKNTINNLRLHDGTGTYNAMKWGLALLDPISQPVVATLASMGEVDPAFADRPSNWSNGSKYLVLMTDGQITQQYRPDNPTDPALATEEVLPFKHPYSQTVSRSKGLGWFYDLCAMAKTRDVTVFTIAFDAPAGAAAEMKACASSEAHFYEATVDDISAVFQQIGSTIQKLKLVE